MLVAFIEEEFGVDVLEADLDVENFSSVKRIVEFVNNKRGK
jgi:acyl carrier protein